MEKKDSLGNYLSSTEELQPGESIEYIPHELIDPNPFQPRKKFKQDSLEEFAAQMREKGFLQPIIIRPFDNSETGKRFQIVAGERRFRAAKIAGISKIPCIIRNYSDKQTREWALLENVQREDLNFMETMNGYVSLREDYGTAEAVSKALGGGRGKSQRSIERYFKLHTDIYSIESVAQIFEAQAAQIDLATAEKYSTIVSDLRRLQKSKSENKKFQRILEQFRKKSIKEHMPELLRKFNREIPKRANNNASVVVAQMLRETEKVLTLSISIKKSERLSEDMGKAIKESMDSFLEKIETLRRI